MRKIYQISKEFQELMMLTDPKKERIQLEIEVLTSLFHQFYTNHYIEF